MFMFVIACMCFTLLQILKFMNMRFEVCVHAHKQARVGVLSPNHQSY